MKYIKLAEVLLIIVLILGAGYFIKTSQNYAKDLESDIYNQSKILKKQKEKNADLEKINKELKVNKQLTLDTPHASADIVSVNKAFVKDFFSYNNYIDRVKVAENYGEEEWINKFKRELGDTSIESKIKGRVSSVESFYSSAKVGNGDFWVVNEVVTNVKQNESASVESKLYVKIRYTNDANVWRVADTFIIPVEVDTGG
ncbi:hypothetical protein HCX58_14125 [Listeria welshimeri]|nr:hypothetical protein [Listeria welshimeri]MBC1350765.1 hypothetical protein [Listeria welshimeri]MBC1705817.1 hypothetical protein [Listeria welshimeri]